MLDLSKFIVAAEPMRALGVVITKDGKEIGRWASEPVIRRNVYSASKSFTSAAVGIAMEEGLLSLDEELVEVFKEDLPEDISHNLMKATVRDLLTMCLGQSKAYLMGSDRPYYTEENWVKLALSLSFDREPNTAFVYNNVGPYLAGLLVQRRSGMNLVDYLYPRLFKPLGIQRPSWETDPLGFTFGAGGLFLTMDELHKFGLLYLNKGKCNGQQLIPEAWVDESSKKQVDNGRDGYGYLFWRGKYNSYRADGKYGQFSIIFPDKGAVVTVVAECRTEGELLRAVYDCIVPLL